jgi:hypothetical protein
VSWTNELAREISGRVWNDVGALDGVATSITASALSSTFWEHFSPASWERGQGRPAQRGVHRRPLTPFPGRPSSATDEGLSIFQGFVLGRFFSAHTDQGSPRRISRRNAGVPPLIYAIPLRVFTFTGGGHHDSPFDLPAVVRGGPAPNQTFGSAVGGTTALLGLPDI